jgi:Hint domain
MGQPNTTTLTQGQDTLSTGSLAIGISAPSTVSTTWTGLGDGTSWNDPKNWDNGVPQSGSNVLISQASLTSISYENPTDITGLASVTIASSSSTYDLESGILVATDGLAIGENGDQGVVNQTGGSATIGVWFDGQALPDGQTYDANAGLVVVGAAGGAGTYTLGITGQTSAPSLQIYGNVVLGQDFGSTGTFALAGDGSSLSENFVAATADNPSNTGLGGNLVVGSSGDGTFTQTDDTSVYLDGGLAVGLNSGSVGQYTLTGGDSSTGGSLSVGTDLAIGGSLDDTGDVNTQTALFGGSGTFEQDSGTVHTYGAVDIGLNGGTGTYTLTDGGLKADGGMTVGANGGGGTFTQTGGTATIGTQASGSTLSLGVGPFSASIGTLNLSSADDSNPGQLTVYGFLDDGQDFGTTGNVVIGTPAASGDPTNLSVDADTSASGGDMIVGDAGNGNLSVYSGTLDVENNLNIGVNGTGTVTQYDGSTVTASFVDMSVAVGSGISNYTINGGVLGTGDLDVGGAATGAALFTQNGGTVNVQDDVGGLSVSNIANNSNPNSYVMTLGTLNVFNTLQIGAGGIATFTQTGGTTTLGSDTINSDVALYGAAALDIGESVGDDGIYTFGTIGGTDATPTLTIDGGAIVGDLGTGAFEQDSDAVAASSSLTIGNGSSGNGTYTLAGGTLTVDSGADATAQADTFVAISGNGNFYNTGGDQTTDALVIGQQFGSTGYYQLTTGAELNMTNSAGQTGNGFLDVGEYGGGTFEQDGGTTTMSGSLDVGRYSGGIGTVFLHGGSIVVGTFADDGLDGTGSITQDSQDAASSLEVAGGDFNIGRDQNSSGTYNIAGDATLTVDTGSLNVGNSGTGLFTQATDAQVTVGEGALNVGLNTSASGTYSLSGGVLTVDDGAINVGAGGAGTFTQTGGNVNAEGGEIIGNNGATTASYTQTGGTAIVADAGGANNALVVGAAGSGTNATYTLSSASQSAPASLVVDQGGAIGGVDIGEDPDATGNFVIGTKGLTSDATTMTVESTDPVMTVGDFGTGNLTVYSGTLDVESYLNIGVNGTGTVVQDGGLVESGLVEMSSYVGDGTSSYTISGGTLFTSDLFVGPPNLVSTTTGTATFIQEGSSQVELDDLNINHLDNGSTSTYTLSGGTLTAAYEDVGSSGIGTFSQSGGSNALYQTLTIGAGGEYDFSGGTLSANGIFDEGTLVASGTNTIGADISGSGNLELTSGAALTVNNSIDSATGIVFASGVETLNLTDQSGTLGTINGFAAGDTINLLNQDFTTADHINYASSTGILTITNPSSTVLATLEFAGSYTQSEFQATGTAITICFYPGTNISTASGEASVEALAIGDLVRTHDGLVKPIRWIGRQTVSRLFADPLRVLPIRIRRNAFGENLPCRDLLVSPDHALLVDGVLIQAGALVNGISVVREADVPQTFTYYHIELDDHSLILAENTPAETFVDNIDRMGFDNWAEHQALYPDGNMISEMPYPRAKAYRQVPRAIRERLAERDARLYGVSAPAAA